MLEGVLKDVALYLLRPSNRVSILGMLEGVLKVADHTQHLPCQSRFNPWYVGGGVKSILGHPRRHDQIVSILGMLEGVLKVCFLILGSAPNLVSILGMLEGVLKAERPRTSSTWGMCFNPWYVGGGVKRPRLWTSETTDRIGFNPWYVGGGVKRAPLL